MIAPKYIVIKNVQTKRLQGAPCETLYIPANSEKDVLNIYRGQHPHAMEVYKLGELHMVFSEIVELDLKEKEEKEKADYLRLKEKFEPK